MSGGVRPADTHREGGRGGRWDGMMVDPLSLHREKAALWYLHLQLGYLLSR